MHKYDVIVLTETWLNRGVYDSKLFDDWYIVYRRDCESSSSIGLVRMEVVF